MTTRLAQPKVIGCGGIATWLLDPLCHYLNFAYDGGVEVTLVDGDTFEDRNADRQRFAVRGNKADVTADRLRSAYSRLVFWTNPVYVTEANVVMLIRDGDVVFLCVDNHKTRQLVSRRCEELDNITLISGGNDYTDGNIQVHIRRDGKDLTLPIGNEYHPEILNAADKNPGEEDTERHGCQQIQESQPQLLFTNMAIASMMLNAYYGVATGRLRYDEAYTDILKQSTRPVSRKRPVETAPEDSSARLQPVVMASAAPAVARATTAPRAAVKRRPKK